MSSEVPASTLYRTQVDVSKLPVSSFRRRGTTYATFQPFDVLDDSDALGNNQLNWTNLFLWNKFGKSLSVADVEAAGNILSIKTLNEETLSQVKTMGYTLSEEFSEVKKMISEMNSSSDDDLSKIQAALKNVIRNNDFEYKFFKIESRLDKLEKTVQEIYDLTKKIAQRL